MPHPTRDVLTTHSNSYIIVIKNNIFYKLNCTNEATMIKNLTEISEYQQHSEHFPGYGTSLGRSEWYDLKSKLGNVDNFKTIGEEGQH